MKASLINKILLSIEVVPVALLLLLSLVLLGDSRLIFFTVLILSILSLISLIYLVVKTVLGLAENVGKRFVYLSHVGLLITALGFIVLLIHGNEFKNHSPEVPFSIFSFGVVACIPYFHVMIINNFFKASNKLKNKNVSKAGPEDAKTRSPF